MNHPITFLISTERSGSNFITRILNSHSEICGPSPSHLLRTLYNNIHRYGDLDRNKETLLGDIADLLNNQLGIWRTKFTQEKLSQGIKQLSVKGIIEYVYSEEAAFNQKQHLFIKENKIYEYIEQLNRDYPESRFIYLVRDPRDFVLSYLKSPNHPGNIEEAAQLWANEQEKYEGIFQFLAKEQRAIKIHYEDLITHSTTVLLGVCTFIGVEYEDNLLRFNEDENTVLNSERLNDWNNLSKSILTDNKNKFNNELSAADIRRIEQVCEDMMDLNGYEKADLSTVSDQRSFAIKELSQDEKELRDKRLEVVRRILARDLS